MMRRYPTCYIIFGAERMEQVLENVEYANLADAVPEVMLERLDAVLPPQGECLLNPALWARK